MGSWFWPSERPAAWLPLLLGATSVGSLLLYFFGTTSLGTATSWLLLPGLLVLVAFVGWTIRQGDHDLAGRIAAGLWAGALATLAYDLVRVPISVSGVPVFKAISYFGTVMLGELRPTLLSEVLGWAYHLSNGMGFGLMYAVAVTRPRPVTAVAWGLILEGIMLMTPYVEVLGYRATPTFLAITIGAHVVYGAVLWASLWAWNAPEPGAGQSQRPLSRRRWRLRLAALTVAVLGIGAIAADSFGRHAQAIPPSPPSYLGKHLYTTWDVPEPDRVAVLWVMRGFVDPEARFHFIKPFSPVEFGIPIDIPEADVRRSGTRSATEVLLEDRGLDSDPKLRALARMTHLFEIARWRLPAHPDAHELGLELVEAVGECEAAQVRVCVERGMSFLEAWYAEGREPPD